MAKGIGVPRKRDKPGSDSLDEFAMLSILTNCVFTYNCTTKSCDLSVVHYRQFFF